MNSSIEKKITIRSIQKKKIIYYIYSNFIVVAKEIPNQNTQENYSNANALCLKINNLTKKTIKNNQKG